MRREYAPRRRVGSARPDAPAAVVLLLATLLSAGCAAGAFSPASAEDAARASRAWRDALARAHTVGDANVLYDASLSQGVLSTKGTLALRLRGQGAEGTLAGPLGATLATYRDGVLRGEKIEPVRLPERQLRAVVAGVWDEGEPEVAGKRRDQFLLRWPSRDAAEGLFDLPTGELRRLTVRRAEGELEARYSGARDPWPERIEIEEKRTGSKLKLKLLSRETPS